MSDRGVDLNYKIDEMIDLLKVCRDDFNKGTNGNKAAGQKASKVLSDVRYKAIEARADVMEGIKRKRGLI